ncbi:hypothetical protein F383_04270 [Gossypium arboreum]|uniref:Uncharacterized protein n=1 Tax=Gossypium arboreum TaxID=29729 RepID=A0A0B0Q1I8_GOSAR|nr:hypothetical protein F383_04270 [Gossypium arboreum]
MSLSTLFQDKFDWRVVRVEAVVEVACSSQKLGLPMLKFFGPFEPKFLIILGMYLVYARANWAAYSCPSLLVVV